jgi:hypothetical protein
MKTMHPRKQSGSSLVVVISVLATLLIVVGVAAEYTWTVNRHVQRSNTRQTAVAVADGCIEILFSNWRRICSKPVDARTPLPTNSFSGIQIPLPTSDQFNLPNVTNFAKRGTIIDPNADELPSPASSDYDPNYTISNYKVIAVGPEWTTLGSSGTAPIPMLGQIATSPSPAPSPTTSLVYNYIASADVTLPALGKDGYVVAKVRRVFQKQQMSPWNFAIFYVDPLEIHPGPEFTVTGWVHTNSDLYTGHDTLTFADKVTYGSDWFTNFMTPAANPRTWVDTNGATQYAVPAPGDTTHPETPTRPHYPGNLPPARDQALQPFGMDSGALFNLLDANLNNDSYRELIEPPTATPDPLSSSRYWDQADVIIQVDLNNNVIIGVPHINSTTGVPDGFVTSIAPPSSGHDGRTPDQIELYNMFHTTGAITPGTDASNGQIYDNREDPNNTIRLVTLDLSKIVTPGSGNANPTYKAANFNGIVYIYDNSASTHTLNPNGSVNPNLPGKRRGGVRLRNGSKIPTMGLTVASPNPLYIQGDFNTGRDYVDGNPSPPSNNSTSDPLQPQVSGYTRAPCSVLADAVTILSNSWADQNSRNTPQASNTTVNTAIISGIVPTNAYGGGNYSGGAENFPRFLEEWSGKQFTYYGSMVELYKSQQSIAVWQYAGVYGAPERQWYFDSNFKVKPPPGSLMLYSYIKGKWSVL